MTVAEFMTRWLNSVRDKVEPNTYRGYEQRSRTHIVRDLGQVKVMELSPLLIEEAEARWLREGNRRSGGSLDPQTVLHIHRVLHAAMDRAVKWRLLPTNPVDGVDAPHVPDKERGFLTAEESERVVAVLVGEEYELPILVGLYCGLRPTEYLALRWRDVDPLDAGELRVTQNVHRIRQDQVTGHMGQRVSGFRFGPAKTHRSKRPVSMPPAVVDLLRDHRRSQAATRLRAGAAWTDLDLLFTDARGYPYNHDRVRRCFYKVLKAAGVRQVVLYALRHTMASLVLHETKNVKLVATRLGHANETLVLRTYGHLLPGVDRQAADRLGEVVKRPGSGRRSEADATRMQHEPVERQDGSGPSATDSAAC
jgi:integrase